MEKMRRKVKMTKETQEEKSNRKYEEMCDREEKEYFEAQEKGVTELEVWFSLKTNRYDCLPEGCPGYTKLGWSNTPEGRRLIIEHAKWMDEEFEKEAGMTMKDFLIKHPTYHSFETMAMNEYVHRRGHGKPLSKEEKLIHMVKDIEKYTVVEKGLGQLFWEVGYGRVKFIDKRFEAKHLAILDLIGTKISNEGWIKKLVVEKKLPVCNVGLSGEEIEQMIDNFDELSAKDRAMFFPKFIALTEGEIRKIQRGNPSSKLIEKTIDELTIIAIKKHSAGKIFYDGHWMNVSITGNFCNSILLASDDNEYAEYQTKRKRRGRGRGYENVYVIFFNTRMAAYFFNNLINAQANILPIEFNKILSPLANILARMLILHKDRKLTLKVATKALSWSEKTDSYDRINKINVLLRELKDKGMVVKDFSKPKRKKQGTIEDTYWNIWMHKKSAFETMEKVVDI